MMGISGIKYQKELEKLPYFNKKTLGSLIGKEGRNLDKKISRLLKSGYLISLKKGLYVSDAYLSTVTDKETYSEYLANHLRQPSYLSLEYILAKNGLIPEAINMYTSITLKSSRSYANQLGSFSYRHLPPKLFIGYETKKWSGWETYSATKTKALFDFFYLKRNLNYNSQEEVLTGTRINWDNWGKKENKEFKSYLKIAQSKKMAKIFNFLPLC